MKNQRDVCYAKDAGFIEFDGLNGSIKTGCPATPDYKSRFCLDHKNQAAELRSHDDQDLDKNEPESEWPTTGFKNGYPLPQLILSKKATRKEAYYQAKNHVKKRCIT